MEGGIMENDKFLENQIETPEADHLGRSRVLSKDLHDNIALLEKLKLAVSDHYISEIVYQVLVRDRKTDKQVNIEFVDCEYNKIMLNAAIKYTEDKIRKIKQELLEIAI